MRSTANISNLISPVTFIGCYESEPSSISALQQYSIHHIARIFGQCALAIVSIEPLVGCSFCGYYDPSCTRCNEKRILDSSLWTHGTNSLCSICWCDCDNSVCHDHIAGHVPTQMGRSNTTKKCLSCLKWLIQWNTCSE